MFRMEPIWSGDEKVMVLWDPTIPDLGHPSCESAQVLLQSKWNKHVVGGWWMAIGSQN